MVNPFFSGRVPEDLNKRIEQHCAETGESKTQLLINALSKYLDFPVKPPAPANVSPERFDQLEERVAELERKLLFASVTNTVKAQSSYSTSPIQGQLFPLDTVE